MMERIVNIYTLTCPSTGHVRYVGKSVNPSCRYSQHCSIKNLRRKKTKLNNWLLKTINNGNKPIFNIIDFCLESDNWQEKEIYWISFYRKLFPICNISSGGEGAFGVVFTEKRKQKIREIHLGKPKNYITYFTGKKRGPMPLEVKEKLSKSLKGRISKRKISVGLFVDNILIHKYKSMSEASKQTGVLVTSISNNILGISKSTMLGVWKKL